MCLILYFFKIAVKFETRTTGGDVKGHRSNSRSPTFFSPAEKRVSDFTSFWHCHKRHLRFGLIKSLPNRLHTLYITIKKKIVFYPSYLQIKEYTDVFESLSHILLLSAIHVLLNFRNTLSFYSTGSLSGSLPKIEFVEFCYFFFLVWFRVFSWFIGCSFWLKVSHVTIACRLFSHLLFQLTWHFLRSPDKFLVGRPKSATDDH